MKTKLIIIGLAALLAAGCYTSSSRMNSVEVGMSKTDVVKMLGEPVSRGVNKDGSETLYYNFLEHFGSVPAPYSVTLEGGKVVAFGRDGGGNQAREPMPVIVPVR